MNELRLTVYILFISFALAKANDRPNVIFIITDDQHRETFGFLENKALTPRIDELANEGCYFNSAYVAASVCTPSRFTCLTGQYASRCQSDRFINDHSAEGVPKIAWNMSLVPGQKTISSVLGNAGYKTGFVGKWHVGGLGWNAKVVPPGSDPSDPDIAAVLKENHDQYCNDIRERFGFDYANAVYRGNPNDDKNLVNTGCNVHNMEWLTQAALTFIESNKEEPFYLYFSPTLIHVPSPLESLKDDPRKSGLGLLDEPITDVLPSRESVIERVTNAGLPEKSAGVTWLDDGIGAILDKLEKLGIAENTLIIYFNDNGMETHAKGTCYEGGIKTPVMLSWKGKIEPMVRDEFISNIDFFPTILDVCGITAPKDLHLDGMSILPLTTKETPKNWRTSIYSEIGYTRSITTKKWKYIAFKVPPSVQRTKEERLKEYEPFFKEQLEKNPWMRNRYEFNPDAPYYQLGIRAGGYPFEWGQLDPEAPWIDNYFDEEQLYNLETDPNESINLVDNPKYEEQKIALKKELKEYFKILPGSYKTVIE